MGILRVNHLGQIDEVELATSTLVGRHRRCHARIDDPRVPTVWVEVRWRGEDWAWRLLVDSGATRGTGALGEHGWRALTNGGKPGRVSCCDGVSIELCDSAAPRTFARNLQTSEVLTGEAFNGPFELWQDGVRPAGWDEMSPVQSTSSQDGGILVVDGVAYELHLEGLAEVTERGELDLTHPKLSLESDLKNLRVSFSLGAIEATLTGESARILAIYAQARHSEHFDEGGWLTREEAHQAWIESGGKADTPPERMAWERGKVRSALAKQGARHLETLFEMRRRANQVETRLALRPDQLELESDP